MKYLSLAAIFLGAILVSVPIVAIAQPSFVYNESAPTSVNAVGTTAGTTFAANATMVLNGTASFNFVGTMPGDIYNFTGGNSSSVFVATGVGNNTFNISTGNPQDNNTGTFSLLGGANTNFTIIQQNNGTGSVAFAITGGANSNLNESTTSAFTNNDINGTTIYSINLGTNSTVNLGSEFESNQTSINVVF